MEEQQYGLQQQVQEKKGSKKEIKHCKKCGATISSEDVFCPECGEKINGEECTCRWCGVITTKEICPDCGKRVIPQICPKCGKEAYFDFCENCGTPLTVQMQNLEQKTIQPVVQMSEDEAKKILAEFEEAETEELKYFRKLMAEHEISLNEKKFFDEREKRIEAVFGTNQTAIKYPDPEETMFLQKASEGIRNEALKREQEAIDENLEKKFPGYQTAEEEHEKLLQRIKETEERFNKEIAEATEKIGADIEIVKEQRRKELEELRRRQEEERKRLEAIEQERKRLELEAFNKRICGRYIHTQGSEEILLSISFENGDFSGVDKTTYSSGDWNGTEFTAKFNASFDGSRICFKETDRRYIQNPHNLDIDALLYEFEGTINSSGTVINGHWFSASNKTKAYIDYRKY